MRDLPLPTMPLADLPILRRPRPEMPPRGPLPERAATGGSRRDMTPAISVSWADSEDEVREAQRLRYQVFAVEMGARLCPPPGTPEGLDVDLFDKFCDHLLVRDTRDGDDGEVIGTYRVLTPSAARRVGGWYSDTEFDLTRLRPLRNQMAELGRSCVHPDHRHGGVILALWAALGGFLTRRGLDTMIGCASITMRDGGHAAASLWNRLRQSHLAPIEHQVQPRLALPVDDLRGDLEAEAPALIKGYLRCGAKVLGAPAWDPDFNTADLPMMMRLQDLPEKYRRHFLSAPDA
ncbi:ornithine-acyl[acyl carrier protein] N-acyltransferase [Sphaerotilus hippei]|uniref:L-ornithine N(alpha)-acyltransferase n=1 Tax=Sphaerotilus hippei TaxID=744406 RepID=A0A318GV11_9BURK|nr:GNAT family N-acyltransferase [Sphaerotilus hippei]PXW91950.1 ornithine-acyl[acyl carrier protein] N-acyltransferase [Sphaerotilus hippei]